MEPPKYPISAERVIEGTELRVAEYHGRRHEKVPVDLTRQHQQFAVDSFLDPLGVALRMLLQLVQTYLPEDQLEQITGDDGARLFNTREEIEGQFNLELTFAAGAMEMEWIISMTEIISKYLLPMDTLSTIQRDKLVALLFSALDPSLADAALVPAQSAQQQEVMDEELNLAKIVAGIEPQMAAEGQNFALRQETLQGLVERNPEFQNGKLTPVSQQLLQARMEHLENQVQQERNKQIGRQVGNPVLS